MTIEKRVASLARQVKKLESVLAAKDTCDIKSKKRKVPCDSWDFVNGDTDCYDCWKREQCWCEAKMYKANHPEDSIAPGASPR